MIKLEVLVGFLFYILFFDDLVRNVGHILLGGNGSNDNNNTRKKK